MMRITIFLVLALVAGTAAGTGIAFWNYYQFPEEHAVELGLIGVQPDADAKYPSAEVDNLDFDFGAMDGHATSSHDFIFRNVGEAPLELEAGATTCKCTLSEIADNVIPPGGSGKVNLEWHGKGLTGSFSQTAEIRTNDPKKPVIKLKIHGELTAKVRLVPDSLVFSSVTAGQPAHGSVQVFGYEPKKLEIESFELDDPENAELTLTPMSSDEVKEEKYATCGQRIDVTLKPGLPLGPFRKRILIKTNLEDPAELSVPIRGTVSSEISILGPGWNPDGATLRLGSVGPGKTVRKLLLKVGGVHPQEITFKVAEVKPEFMNVRLLERTSTPGSSVAITPIEIEIPEGSPPCNYLGPQMEKLARIRVTTNHPTVKELDIYISFLISG